MLLALLVLFAFLSSCSLRTWIEMRKIPKGYYEIAERRAPKPQDADIASLALILQDLKLPSYEEGLFDCSEASAFLEWYLEGAGFSADLVSFKEHMWLMVKLGEGEVAVDPTFLCRDNFHPPGIIADPEGEFARHTLLWREYLKYLQAHDPERYKLPRDFEDFVRNYYKMGWDEELIPAFQAWRKWYSYENRFADIYTAVKSGFAIEELDWWNVRPLDSFLK